MTVEVRTGENVDVNYTEIASEKAESTSACDSAAGAETEAGADAGMEADATAGSAQEAKKVDHDWHVGVKKMKGHELNAGIEWHSDKDGKEKKYEWKWEFAPKRLFWGILLIVGAIALVLNRLGYLGGLLDVVSVWDIILTVFFLVTLVEGVIKGRIGETLFSVAFLINIHDTLLGLEAITPWTTLGAALLGTIGLKMLFPKAGKKHKGKFIINGEVRDKGICEESRTGNTIKYENVFSSTVKYVAGEFSRVKVENAFGTMQIYFSDAQPIEGTAKVDVESVFGNVILYVPAEWKVVVKSDHVLGSTSEKGQCNPDGTTVLYVNAEALLGKFEIKYI